MLFKKLNAYIVSYAMQGKEANKNDIKSIVIVAYSKKEAGDIFIRWAHAKRLYKRICACVTQKARKTRQNSHMITKDFYERQNAEVSKMESWLKNGGKADA